MYPHIRHKNYFNNYIISYFLLLPINLLFYLCYYSVPKRLLSKCNHFFVTIFPSDVYLYLITYLTLNTSHYFVMNASLYPFPVTNMPWFLSSLMLMVCITRKAIKSRHPSPFIQSLNYIVPHLKSDKTKTHTCHLFLTKLNVPFFFFFFFF